jgi:DNA-binding IscR family transcriptional regulator
MKEDDWFKKLHASYREIEFGKIYEWINGPVAVTATDETEWNDENCMLKTIRYIYSAIYGAR